ncbi:thioredoxin domain-containing protein [Patescibacteria group bacterium]|nr:thioredoxin domain-containing protein [Patescibacteria group bacterium]
MGLFKKNGDLFKDLKPQQSFFMGAGWGVAVAVTILLIVFMVSLLGSSGSADKKLAVVNTNTNVAPTQPAQPTPPVADASKLPSVTNSDYIQGDKNAQLTLIEYSDFQCPFCSRHTPTLDKVLDEYKGKVRLVFRHFPLNSIHPQAQKAAEAAECAGEQGKFWEMHDKIFANQTAISVENLKSYASALGLNASQFNDCLDNDKYASKVQQQMQGGAAAGVTGTPATFIGDQLVKGAVPYENLKSIIDSKLK